MGYLITGIYLAVLPHLSAAGGEVGLADGTVAAITRTTAEAAAATRENRAMRVYTLDEIGRLLSSIPSIAKVKEYFPGAEVTAVRPELPELPPDGDEFPDIFAA